tara:strand:- start:1196 stop:1486 length:291 start_codon:yes stop_codon:yes gene_type:complete
MKPRIVPQPFEDRRKLRNLVAHWQLQVDALQHRTESMDYRIANTMLTWCKQRLQLGQLWFTDRQEWKRQNGADVNTPEYRKLKQQMRRWEREQTLG